MHAVHPRHNARSGFRIGALTFTLLYLIFTFT